MALDSQPKDCLLYAKRCRGVSSARQCMDCSYLWPLMPAPSKKAPMEAARPKQYVCSGALHICRQGQRQDTVRSSQGLQPAVCSCPATCHKQKYRAAGHVIHPWQCGRHESPCTH